MELYETMSTSTVLLEAENDMRSQNPVLFSPLTESIINVTEVRNKFPMIKVQRRSKSKQIF